MLHTMPLGIVSAQASAYLLEQSLLFDGAAYLSRTPSVAGNRKTFTFSVWFKRGGELTAATGQTLFNAGVDANNRTTVQFTGSGDYILFNHRVAASNTVSYFDAALRDPSAWYHLVLAVDTTQSTAADRVKFYINGTLLTNNGSSAYPAQNTDLYINATNVQEIGRAISASYFPGLMALPILIDGAALDPTSFGEEDADGYWNPIAYTGSYGTNGGAYDFADTANFGNDIAGSNDYTPTGFVAADQVADTPTDDTALEIGNHVTFTPIARFSNVTLSEANRVMTSTSGSQNCELTIAPESGKFIFEINASTAGNIGMAFCNTSYDRTVLNPVYLWGDSTNAVRMFRESNTNLRTYYNTGSGVNTNIGVTIDNTNDRIVYAIDADNRYLWLGLWDDSASAYIWLDGSGGVTGNPATGANPTFTMPGTGPIYIAGETGTGQPITLYSETAKMLGSGVSGFKALATQNLPAPTIADGSEYFNTVLYTGNGTAIGSGGNAITGVGFQPDFVWMKSRSAATDHALYDSVRGTTKEIISNSAAAESTLTEGLTAFGTDGFTLGSDAAVNTNTATYAAWCWKAGGTAASNTDGTITSSVSANTTSGFSIMKYTGNATSGATVGHGLSSAPKFMIGKNLTEAATNWCVYHSVLTGTDFLQLDTTGATQSNVVVFNNTDPSASVVTLGSGTRLNGTSTDYILYAWAEVEGFSKFGSYTGNGNANGPFIYTGFRPAFVLFKRATVSAGSWAIMDNKRNTYNPVNTILFPDLTSADEGPFSYYDIDYVSNGFKIRTSNSQFNVSGSVYIYAAFAENPFQGDDGVTQARAR